MNNTCQHPYSAVGTRYTDGGRQIRCGAWQGAPPDACGQSFYLCPHGIEATGIWARAEGCTDCHIEDNPCEGT